ncbi:FG-GAP-like repeat-containing protein [Myxococcota bacterium]|nr:FG-GAP-like repeat-containing protein [Myxococcota bacterium]
MRRSSWQGVARWACGWALGAMAGCAPGLGDGVADPDVDEGAVDGPEATAHAAALGVGPRGVETGGPRRALRTACTASPVSPAEGADLTAGANFIWNGDCAGYRVEVSADPAFPAHAVYVFGRFADVAGDNAFSPSATVWSSIGRRFTTAGYWRVVGGLDGDIAASETRSFFTTMAPLPPPPAPVEGCAVALDSPADGATIDAAPTFVWATDCTGAYLELSADVTFPVEASYYFGAVSNGRYTIGETLWASLAPRFAVDGGYWRVTAGAAEGSEISEVRAFNRPPVGGGDGPIGPIEWTGQSGQAGSNYGYSVASAGDVNGDGYADVVVGAPYWNGALTSEGAAFLYLGSATGLSTSPDWIAEGGQQYAFFGKSVASAGDVNGDGYDDVVVGAPNWTEDLSDEGAAFLFLGSASGLGASPAWTALGGQEEAFFGNPVASAGDVNGDGHADLVVAGTGWDGGLWGRGAAWVFLGSPSGLGPSPSWVAEGEDSSDDFGKSVASAGDVDGDGFADVVVGAPSASEGELREGKAYLYRGSASGLAPTPAWSAEGGQSEVDFGASVGSAGDVNWDGYSDVVVGAWRWDGGAINGGAAFLFLGSAGGLAASAAWSAEGEADDLHLGGAVASAGDVNGDGFSDVLVGASARVAGEISDDGAAFLFLGSAGGLEASAAWSAQGDLANTHFGASVAGAGDVDGDWSDDLLVGVPGWDGDTDEGAAYLYPGIGGAPPDDGDGDGFAPPDDCDDADPAAYPGATENCDGIDQDCDDVVDNGFDLDGEGWTTCGGDCDDGEPTVFPGAVEVCDGIDQDCDAVVDNGFDLDGDGWTTCAGDCDDEDPSINPAAEDVCDGVDMDCDGADARPGVEAACPALSCLDALAAWPFAPDGLYWVDPLGTGAEQVHCDMAGGGWTLVYRATNDGLVAENGVVEGPAAIGAVPITPTSTGNNKLDDSVINALRSGAVENDLKVVVYADGAVLSPSYHRSACTLQSGSWLNATDVCNQSTTSGPDATDWVQSGHAGSLTRWYVDGAVGYIWPYTHVGPISTGWAHGGNLPNPYCTWYDYRVCNQATYFEIWAY